MDDTSAVLHPNGWVSYPSVVLYQYGGGEHTVPPRRYSDGKPAHLVDYRERILDLGAYDRLRSSGALLAAEHTGATRPTWANPHERTTT